MDSTYLTHSFPNFPILEKLTTGGGANGNLSGLKYHFFSFVRNSRPGGRGCKSTFSKPQMSFFTPHGLHNPHILPFYGLHILPFYGLHILHFMDSTIPTFLTYLRAKNTKYLFMDSTKVLVSTLKIRPAVMFSKGLSIYCIPFFRPNRSPPLPLMGS